MSAPLDRTRSAGYLTNWAARLFARRIDQRLRNLGVSSGQLPVFFALAGGKRMTQKELARAAAIEQPTMAATLARMERDGLIERTTNPDDGRSALIALTAAAARKARAVREAIDAVNREALAGLGAADAEAFLATLQKVIAALERNGQ
jgi:DNA-binding MarR family transcriptional regulator